MVIVWYVKVIYCYGDLVPRHGELFEGKEEQGGRFAQHCHHHPRQLHHVGLHLCPPPPHHQFEHHALPPHPFTIPILIFLILILIILNIATTVY